MAVIYGTVPDAVTLAAFEASKIAVARWADVWQPDAAVTEKYSLWRSQVPIVDGQVTVDMNRDERRNLDITLGDPDGVLGYGPGAFWYDKIIKVYRGVVLPDTTDPGYVLLPGVTGNAVTFTRSALASVTHYEVAGRFRFDVAGVAQQLIGLSTTGGGLALTSGNLMNVSIAKTTSGVIGGANSSAAIPNFAATVTAGIKIWLRAKVTVSTAVCEYYYSLDDTNDIDFITWTQIGTNVTGSNAAGAVDLTKTTTPIFGSISISAAGLAGRMYAGYEAISNAKTIEFDATNYAGNAATFMATAGGTGTVASTGSVPAYLVASVNVPGNTWVTSLGEFIPDVIERPRFPKALHVTARDFTKKCLLSKFTQSTSWAVGSTVATIIKTIAQNAGIVKFNFATPTNVLSQIITFDRNVERWKAMKQLADSIGYELFFDGYGNLTLRPFVDPLTAPLYYTFKTGAAGNLVDFKKTTNDAQMFNRIVVYGDGPDNPLVYGEATNTTPTSPTSIANIGERVNTISSAFVGNNTDAAALALKYLKVSGLEQFVVSQTSLVIPWMEAGSAVELLVDDAAPGDPTRYLYTDFTIPLGLSPMDGNARRVTIVG